MMSQLTLTFICFLLSTFSSLIAAVDLDLIITTPIYIKSLTTDNVEKFGDLHYDKTSDSGIFNPELDVISIANEKQTFSLEGFDDDKVCIGLKDEVEELNCFSFKKISNPVKGKFIIHTNTKNIPYFFDFIVETENLQSSQKAQRVTSSKGRGKSAQKEDDSLIPVVVEKVSPGVRPTLKSPEIKEKKTKEQVAKEKIEGDKTFFQKYWMYLLPIAIMVMFGGGGDSNAAAPAPK